jgi:hypothetical protein
LCNIEELKCLEVHPNSAAKKQSSNKVVPTNEGNPDKDKEAPEQSREPVTPLSGGFTLKPILKNSSVKGQTLINTENQSPLKAATETSDEVTKKGKKKRKKGQHDNTKLFDEMLDQDDRQTNRKKQESFDSSIDTDYMVEKYGLPENEKDK